MTAKTVLDSHYNACIDDNNFGIILTTDLSSAFDTVDHSILVKKLQYYRIDDQELQLIKSYLTNRTQFVEIQTKTSKLIK